MADVPLVNNPMTAVADTIIGGTVTGGVAAPTRLKNNFSAAVAPAVTDDSGDGYAIGSRWIDTTADKEYVALDVTVGAAVWTETTGTGAGGSVATDAIWDAAGDLAVGSGANTAARLAIGAAGGALSRVNGAVAWNSGTAFPTAATGDRYWRTDLGLECYYDGTRWLTVQEYTLSNSAASLAADGIFYIALSNTYAMWFTSWDVASYVGGAATWVVTLQTMDTESDVAATLDSVSTAAQNAAEWYATTRALGVLVDATGAHAANEVTALRVWYDEQGGTATFLGGVNIRYRLVIT